VLRDIDLATLAEFIDWGPFFQTWDLAGSFPKILDDALVGETARAVFADAQKMLQTIIEEKWLRANAVFGLFPANAVGDDIEIYADETRSETLDELAQPAPATGAPAGKPHYCLSDFVAARGTPDWLGAFAVGAGFGIEEARRVRRRARRLPRDHAESARRPPRRSLCRVAARAGAPRLLGLRRRRRRSTARH
jgi:5-methyltetrahydrofolate--homocysteine methyltransferase